MKHLFNIKNYILKVSQYKIEALLSRSLHVLMNLDTWIIKIALHVRLKEYFMWNTRSLVIIWVLLKGFKGDLYEILC